LPRRTCISLHAPATSRVCRYATWVHWMPAPVTEPATFVFCIPPALQIFRFSGWNIPACLWNSLTACRRHTPALLHCLPFCHLRFCLPPPRLLGGRATGIPAGRCRAGPAYATTAVALPACRLQGLQAFCTVISYPPPGGSACLPPLGSACQVTPATLTSYAPLPATGDSCRTCCHAALPHAYADILACLPAAVPTAWASACTAGIHYLGLPWDMLYGTTYSSVTLPADFCLARLCLLGCHASACSWYRAMTLFCRRFCTCACLLGLRAAAPAATTLPLNLACHNLSGLRRPQEQIPAPACRSLGSGYGSLRYHLYTATCSPITTTSLPAAARTACTAMRRFRCACTVLHYYYRLTTWRYTFLLPHYIWVSLRTGQRIYLPPTACRYQTVRSAVFWIAPLLSLLHRCVASLRSASACTWGLPPLAFLLPAAASPYAAVRHYIEHTTACLGFSARRSALPCLHLPAHCLTYLGCLSATWDSACLPPAACLSLVPLPRCTYRPLLPFSLHFSGPGTLGLAAWVPASALGGQDSLGSACNAFCHLTCLPLHRHTSLHACHCITCVHLPSQHAHLRGLPFCSAVLYPAHSLEVFTHCHSYL